MVYSSLPLNMLLVLSLVGVVYLHKEYIVIGGFVQVCEESTNFIRTF
jgi:hypothetical protein